MNDANNQRKAGITEWARTSDSLWLRNLTAGKYIYKEKIPGEQRYKTRCISEVTTIQEAVAAAVEIAFRLQQEQTPQGVSDLFKTSSASS